MKHYFSLFLVGAFLSLLSVLSLTSRPVAAAAVMKIVPVANGISVNPGDVQNYQFTLENVGTEDFDFRLYTAPYNVINEDYDVDFTTETARSQITRWITFQDDSGSFISDPVFTLKAGEKRTIVYRVSVPDDIPEGGQYCMIFAESIPKQDGATSGVSAEIESVSRVSLILIGHGAGDTKDVAKITDFDVTGFFTAGGVDAMAKVENTGNTDFLAVYNLSVDSIFGKNIYTSSNNFVVLPGSERKFSTSWADAPLFGIFKISYSVKALDVSKEEKHVVLILPMFMLVILLLLLTSISVWTIIWIRKRKERSSRLVV